jgi:hypothetical protein
MMGRSNRPRHQDAVPQNLRGGRPRPFALRNDLRPTARSGPAQADDQRPPTDGIFNSGMGYQSTPDGGTRLWAMVGLGNGELNPMAIAAICAGVSIFFVFGGCVISFHDHPAWTFAVFLLAFLQAALATALAFYESATRRTNAIAPLPDRRPAEAQVVLPAAQPLDGG